MPRNAGTEDSRLRIRTNRLLLVEGKDEVNLFKALIGRHLDGEVALQVIDAGGKDKFPERLRAIREVARAGPALRSVGVIRHADDDAGSAFRSVCDQVRNVGYEPPAAHGGFSEATPSVGVFIVPDGAEPGAIESLCRRAVEGTDIARCVEEYLECLKRSDAMQSHNADKSFAHAYLAAMSNPMARVGEGARRGVWDFGAPAFSELCRFVRELAARGAG